MGEIIFVNSMAVVSEKGHVADFKALKKAYDVVEHLHREIEQLKIQLHESDSRNIYMGKLLAQTKAQLSHQSYLNFQNQVLFEL